MSQPTNLIVENGSGAVVRADMNNIFEALKSAHSGTARPAYAVAGTIWHNTTDGKWYLFNGSTDVAIVGATDTIEKAKTAENATAHIAKTDNPHGVTKDQIGLGSVSNVVSIPVGMFCPFAATTVPNGFLECNGALIKRSVFSELFAVIGTTWGAGDGTTTFQLPDLRGTHLRGWDNGRGLDPARAFGSYQADEIKAHTHTYIQYPNVGYKDARGTWWGNEITQWPLVKSTGSTGGSENRVKNQTCFWMIKYK